MHRRALVAIATIALVAVCGSARADERAALEQLRNTTLSLIQLLVEQGVIGKDKADALLREAERRATAAASAPAGHGKPAPARVRVPYVPEVVKNEIREQLKQEVLAQARAEGWAEPNAYPSWLDRIAFEGDLRVRAQVDGFQADNAPPAFFQVQGQTGVTNTLEDRHRLNLRARLGASLRVGDIVTGGMRLTTGSSSSPVSTSATLGNTFSKHTVALDRAWVRLQPLDWLRLEGGRMSNPFFGTDLVWHNDLGFDGVSATVAPFTRKDLAFRPFVTAGLFPIQEVELSSRDKWLEGGQIGAEHAFGPRTRLKFGVGYYRYRNIAGVPNSPAAPNLFDFTAPQFRQKGNTVFNIDADGNPGTNLWALAADYRLVNLTAVLDLAQWDPVHVLIAADVVKNVGFDRDAIRARTGLDLEPQTRGHQVRLTVGHPQVRELHEWQVFAGYRHLQRDAVLDAFTDGDFHLGGTNHKGWMLGFSYGIGRNAALSMRWMSSTQITGAPLAIDVLQVDLGARF